jgi:hypothetical protein
MKMKRLILILTILLPMFANGQTNDAEKKQTKFEEFSSKTGKISKFIDINLPGLSQNFMGVLETGVRTIIGGDRNAYFYRIEKPETSSSISRIAMIEYSDLVEINKALSKLISEVDADCAANPDYLENRFITEDGFQIGYYVSNGKASWYLKLERYSNSTVFIKNSEELSTKFLNAQKKIEELKTKYGK